MTELKNERRSVAALRSTNEVLSKKVDSLTQQLSAARQTTKRVVFVDEKLYVCGGTIRCEKYHLNYENVTGVIDTIKGVPVTMTVSHCRDCRLYFIRDVVFDSCREKYGTLLGKFIRKKDGIPSFFFDLTEALLHRHYWS